MSAVTEDGGEGASAQEVVERVRDGDEDLDEEEEDGFEFGDADEAMLCVEMAGRSTADGALRAETHDYEALAARKRKALAEEQPQRCGVSFPCCFGSVVQCSIKDWETVWLLQSAGKHNLGAQGNRVPSSLVQHMCILRDFLPQTHAILIF